MSSRYLKILSIGFLLIWVLFAGLICYRMTFGIWSAEPQPANVEVVVSKRENVQGWTLSPGGDKIAYNSVSSDGVATKILLFPETKQKHLLSDECDGSVWLDNTKLLCLTGDGKSIFVLTTDDFTVIPLKDVEASAIDDLEESLQNASANKAYSPNEVYYYRIEGLSPLTIHNASTAEKLAEFSIPEPNYIVVGGWAADSSGVYFQVQHGGFINAGSSFFLDPREGIRKLKVP